jgi:hypothetical protein
MSAPELERAFRAATQQILSDRAAIAGAIEELNIDANRLPSIGLGGAFWAFAMRGGLIGASADLLPQLADYWLVLPWMAFLLVVNAG